MSKLNDSLHLIFRSLRRLISLSFIFASMLLVVRLYELIITSNYYNYPPGSFLYILAGLKFDLIIYLRISAVLMIPFLLIAYFSQKAARNFYISISVFLILGDILLLKYFSSALVPLGADLFGYSVSEIKHTIQTSGEASVLPFVFITLFLVYVIRVFHKHVYYKLKPWLVAVVSFFMFCSLLPIDIFKAKPSNFNNEFSMFAATNKLNFFCESIFAHYVKKSKMNYEDYEFQPLPSTGENSFTYVDAEYPFLHEESTPNVLDEYLELSETPPNIVFLIVESLGRAYSGDGAYLGSFTPFLDSLMENSLYWENCLSTSGRTFQVLPSMLASVPFGDHGFAELGENMPDHISIMSLLKKEAGYYSSFTYGGEAEFDKMDEFVNRQGIDKIIDGPEFGAKYKKMPASSSGFSWGYGDNEILMRHLDDVKANNDKPRMDVILTLSMHSPFLISNQEKYLAEFSKRVAELDLTDKIRTFDHGYDMQFSTILYFDESIKHFFSEFEKLPEYKNTIFVITGDHRMPEIPISTQLDRFHVPLIIYSPMLKKAQKFSSIVTHFDIAPTLIALLDGKNYIDRPNVASWIGHGLDVNEDFRFLNTYPLMRNKNEILDFLDSTKFLANGIIYKVYDNMNIEPNKDAPQYLQSRLDAFIQMNNYACTNNKLIPDSLKRYTVIQKNSAAK